MPNISEELFKYIKRLQITTNKAVEEIFSGAYHSAFKGRGLEFEEVKEYFPGDDIRTIDWNVTARMNHPYVKSYREERELTILLIIDASASCNYGSGTQIKRDLIAEVGAILALSAIKNEDKVGLILFTDEVEKYVPPKKGVKHVLRLVRDLLEYQTEKRGTNIGKALQFAGNLRRRHTVTFLISDFISPEFNKEAAFIAERHDFTAIYIADPTEIRFPPLGLVTLRDLEKQTTQVINTSQIEAQQKLQNIFVDRQQYFEALMKKIGAGYLYLKTNESPIKPLISYFKKKAKTH